MKEIKSVRVRKKYSSDDGALDLRVVLFDKTFSGRSTKAVEANVTGFDPDKMKAIWPEIEYTGSRYKDYTDDQILDEYIGLNSKIVLSQSGVSDEEKLYEIIQNPWTEKPPVYRSFGFDPYYLNNGAQIKISWFESDGVTIAGGEKWSNDYGQEVDVPRGATVSFKIVGNYAVPDTSNSEKNSYIKIIECLEPKTSERLMFSDVGIVKFSFEAVDSKFTGNVKDLDIIDQFISNWQNKVPNYDLKLCDPNNQKCEVVEYKSPLKLPDEKTAEQLTNENRGNVSDKPKLVLKLPEEFEVRSREDVPNFSIWFGNPNIEATSQFDFGADELKVDDEYIETTFEGCDESQLEHQQYESAEVQQETEKAAESVNTTPYVPGKYKLDMIPGEFMTNNKTKIKCCQIGKKPVNVAIADKLLDMLDAAKKSGINITINSGFRPGYGSSISTKSESGVSVSADSQEVLYNKFLKNGSPDTAKPGSSKHGSGIAVDLSTGTRTGAKGISVMNGSSAKVYAWLVKNSWKFGFVRAVGTEEWHYEYWPDQAKNGPYARIKKGNKLYYADLEIDNLQGPNWGSSIT